MTEIFGIGKKGNWTLDSETMSFGGLCILTAFLQFE
jgi:hypothetical protein